MPQPEPNQVTRLLIAMGEGEGEVAEALLPLVYDELRSLARSQMAREGSPQTLQPTALVHEAYLRLVGDREIKWNSRRHFFAAAAQAMRRILVENARRRKQIKRGGGRQREDVFDTPIAVEPDANHLIELDDALALLEARDPRKAEVVMLRYFAGLTIEQTALAMELSPATVKNEWAYARAWLYRQMQDIERTDEGKVAS
jgi:RNA polymerase sigma factor (TIGR02999 family)